MIAHFILCFQFGPRSSRDVSHSDIHTCATYTRSCYLQQEGNDNKNVKRK